MLPSQCATSKEEVPMAFRRWLNVKMPGAALGSSRVQDRQLLGCRENTCLILFDPFCALCILFGSCSLLHVCCFMSVGFCLNLVDLV